MVPTGYLYVARGYLYVVRGYLYVVRWCQLGIYIWFAGIYMWFAGGCLGSRSGFELQGLITKLDPKPSIRISFNDISYLWVHLGYGYRSGV